MIGDNMEDSKTKAFSPIIGLFLGILAFLQHRYDRFAQAELSLVMQLSNGSGCLDPRAVLLSRFSREL